MSPLSRGSRFYLYDCPHRRSGRLYLCLPWLSAQPKWSSVSVTVRQAAVVVSVSVSLARCVEAKAQLAENPNFPFAKLFSYLHAFYHFSFNFSLLKF